MKKTGNKTYILDANVVIDLLKGKENVAFEIDKSKAVYIPVFALGELYLGAESSNRIQYHLDQINAFLTIANVSNTSDNTALIYGKMKSDLKRKGTPIPENDIWIAALAKEHDLPIVTRDKHFNNLTDIKLVEW
ncbi:MAG: type II toxin-antitoxin system VapC family toxin [Cyclobacteriaceae bacterium]|nr:type II toxin-antitoxin system VapC family toxin [Cyclobacteriaceae bacterium]